MELECIMLDCNKKFHYNNNNNNYNIYIYIYIYIYNIYIYIYFIYILLLKDRRIVEELFVSGKIQVLIATSTLAWGVNFPARLVIVKGTEFFDAK